MAMISKTLTECNNYDSSTSAILPVCISPVHGIGNLTLTHLLFDNNRVTNGAFIRGGGLYIHGDCILFLPTQCPHNCGFGLVHFIFISCSLLFVIVGQNTFISNITVIHNVIEVSALPLIGYGSGVFLECSVDGSYNSTADGYHDITTCNVSLNNGIIASNILQGNAIDDINNYPLPIVGEFKGAGIALMSYLAIPQSFVSKDYGWQSINITNVVFDFNTIQAGGLLTCPTTVQGAALAITNIPLDVRHLMMMLDSNDEMLSDINAGGRFIVKDTRFSRNSIYYSCPQIKANDAVKIYGALSIESVWSVDIHQCHWHTSSISATLISQYELITGGAAISVITHLEIPSQGPHNSTPRRSSKVIPSRLQRLESHVRITSCIFTKSFIVSVAYDNGLAAIRGIDVYLDSATVVPRRVILNDCSFDNTYGHVQGQLEASLQGSVLVRTIDGGKSRLSSSEARNFSEIRITNVRFDSISYTISSPIASSCTIGAFGELHAGRSDDNETITTSLINVTVTRVYAASQEPDPTALCTTSILLDRYRSHVIDEIKNVSVRASDAVMWNSYLPSGSSFTISHLLIDIPIGHGLFLSSSSGSSGYKKDYVLIQDSVLSGVGLNSVQRQGSALVCEGIDALTLTNVRVINNTALTSIPTALPRSLIFIDQFEKSMNCPLFLGVK
jgi:hypothetical protein